ncbi:insulin-like growth factor I [Neodiprion pinetum]|uniref:Insulin-like growth factor I n=1 Tax=Neodiprion lecontei TaxID=441921 RepID=A0ABM3GDS6_NEOLC|nr:insulin-like growth factor I [Neodiprion fabricii]XP_046486723.1 insulin-like growth factor I [Neodiprion pinetum]XP_046598401.1 insulin-like growth factor I [Neodiprion lecontei]
MPGERTRSPRATGIASMSVVLLALTVLLQLLLVNESEARPSHMTFRLCSRSLSDALYLVCKDSGFNEPFSYSGEDNDEEDRRPVPSTGPRRLGLVQECCHRYCSLEHLQRYCKPLPQTTMRGEDPASQGNSIGSQLPQTPYKIVNLPYSTVKEMPIAKDQLASNAARLPRRKRRKNARQKHAKACSCHGPKRRKQRIRTRWRKVSRETVIPLVPAFQVGTTSPEPIDSIVIFPFKSELSLGRIDGPVLGPEKRDQLRQSR